MIYRNIFLLVGNLKNKNPVLNERDLDVSLFHVQCLTVVEWGGTFFLLFIDTPASSFPWPKAGLHSSPGGADEAGGNLGLVIIPGKEVEPGVGISRVKLWWVGAPAGSLTAKQWEVAKPLVPKGAPAGAGPGVKFVIKCSFSCCCNE